MKKLIFLPLLISVSVSAQMPGYFLLPASHVDFKSQLTTISLLDSVYEYTKPVSAWEYATKNVNYLYDFNGNLLNYEYKVYSTSNSWDNHLLYLFHFDSLFNIGYSMEKIWNFNQYANSIQTVTYNNSFYHPDSLLLLNWAAGTWHSTQRWIYTYDNFQNNTSETFQTKASVWQNTQKYEYTYNANNLKTSFCQKYWYNNSWNNQYMDTIIYDINNNELYDTLKLWNDTTGWSINGYWTNYYDVNNNVITQTFQSFNGVSFTLSTTFTYTYDSNNRMIELVTDYPNVSNDRKTHWYYSDHFTGINEINNEYNFTLSPNPFTSQTTLSFSEEQTNTHIILTDILGKEIKTTTFSGKQYVIEKGELKPGIYFVKIAAGSQIISKKLIIQ